MKKQLFSCLICGALFLGALSIVRTAQAVLGETADSLGSDEKALTAVRRTASTHGGYRVHEITSESAVVREYLSSAGVVFGIAWNGLAHPDLAPLLGSYAVEYGNGLSQAPRKRGRRHLQVKTSRVIVEKWGHMRNLQGRAYVPDLIPFGVNIDDIK